MRFLTLDDWLRWQESLHPSEIELGLERVRLVVQRMGLVRPDFAVIIVAGTNGKGSSVAMLASILRAAGYTVGSYTSPHLLRYNERIQVDGEAVTDEALCASFARVDAARGDTSLTYFEFGTLAAIDILQRRGVEIAVLEVGLGGRLDAVNVLDADVALITPIDVDHVAWLGTDREAIGLEKAGILRPGRPAVCADPAPPASVLAHARTLGAPLVLAGRDYRYAVDDGHWCWQSASRRRHALPLPALRGNFQVANAAGVLAVLERLADRFPVDQRALREGLLSVQLPGRFHVLPGTPQRILDVAHNPHSAQALVENLAQAACNGRTHAVVGMLADKDIAATLDVLRGGVDHWYLADLALSRAAPASALNQALRGQGTCYADVATAYAAAVAEAGEGDRVVVCGSFHTVAEALAASV